MTEQHDRGAVIEEWWRKSIADRTNGRARALAARLRRAEGIEVLAEPEVHALAARLGLTSMRAEELIQLVQVLAQVRESSAQNLAQRLGGGDPQPLSPLRFQRLLRARGIELATALRRALPIVDRRCNVAGLGRDLLNWDHPDWGDKVRTRWSFAYFSTPYANAATAPDETPPEIEP